MELKIYYRILLKRWWIPLLTFLITILAAFALNTRQPDIYESRATFVIRPRSEIVLDDEFVRALDIVSRRIEINTTFAEVANSKLIMSSAIDRLALPPEKQVGLTVNGRVIGGTNILQISTQGTDPVVVRDFTNAVGIEIVEYVQNLYDVFELQPLDEASIPASPVRSKAVLNLVLGAVLGLGLGVSLVFLLEYLESPREEKDFFNIIDQETGVYNKSYLMHRLWQEMRRAQRNKYALSLGMIRVEMKNAEEEWSARDRIEALCLVKIFAEKSLREEDIMARFDHDTLAILLPDMDEKKARTFMENLRLSLDVVSGNNGRGKLLLKSTAESVTFSNHSIKQERFLQQVVQALDESGVGFGEAVLATNNHN